MHHSKAPRRVRPIFDIVCWKVGDVGFDDPTFLPPLSLASVGLFLCNGRDTAPLF